MAFRKRKKVEAAASAEGRRPRRRGLFGPAVSLFLMAAAVYTFVLRRWHKKWGATGLEAAQPMPGDEIIADPSYVTTRAISINVRPEQVWPWLVQMGEGRGGFYSYDWIERLMGMRVESVSEILPEFQQLKTGDVIPMGDEGITVAAVEPNRHLVLRSSDGGRWGSSTWSMELHLEDGGTRLVSRVRARPVPRRNIRMFFALLEPGMFAMERKWLIGVKQRAESSVYVESGETAGMPAGEQQAA